MTLNSLEVSPYKVCICLICEKMVWPKPDQPDHLLRPWDVIHSSYHWSGTVALVTSWFNYTASLKVLLVTSISCGSNDNKGEEIEQWHAGSGAQASLFSQRGSVNILPAQEFISEDMRSITVSGKCIYRFQRLKRQEPPRMCGLHRAGKK